MKQIVRDVFTDETLIFPCLPRDIKILRYALPDTLETREQEEAAARILWVSQELNRWVGVSWSYLSDEMKEGTKARRLEKQHLKTSPEVIQTGIWAFGIKHVIAGIEELLSKKLLKGVDLRTENPVFFPTPELVQLIMKKQGISATT